MRNRYSTPASALAAIAAVLALSSTPALSQDAAPGSADAPIVNLPPVSTTAAPVAPTTAPSPGIVLPDVNSPGAISTLPATTSTTTTPSVPAAPAALITATPAPRAVTSTVTPRAESAPTPARTVNTRATTRPAPMVADVSAPTERAPDTADIDSEEPLAAAPAAVSPVADDTVTPSAAPTPQQTTDATGFLALALIGLVGLALAAFALVAFRRRPKKTGRAAPVIEKPLVEPRPTPAAVAPATVAAMTPLAAEAPVAPSLRGEPRDNGLAHQGAAVALPRTLPDSYEERDALIKRMAAAKPDRANPFVSYKARVRRARLILQSLDRKFERAQPWIDLSQYSRNWPALGRQPAYRAA